jgi:hypothetical protein
MGAIANAGANSLCSLLQWGGSSAYVGGPLPTPFNCVPAVHHHRVYSLFSRNAALTFPYSTSITVVRRGMRENAYSTENVAKMRSVNFCDGISILFLRVVIIVRSSSPQSIYCFAASLCFFVAFAYWTGGCHSMQVKRLHQNSFSHCFYFVS